MTCKVCNGTGKIPVIGNFTNPCVCSKPLVEAKTKQARLNQDCLVDKNWPELNPEQRAFMSEQGAFMSRLMKYLELR